MAQDLPERPSEKSLRGAIFRPGSYEELLHVIELAFDYRGDITLELTSRAWVSGYLFNRVVDGPHSYVEVFPPDRPSPRRIPCVEIHAVRFTGEDTASGKSWEAWVQKNGEKRKS